MLKRLAVLFAFLAATTARGAPLPASAFFSDFMITHLAIAPDAHMIAYLVSQGGKNAVCLMSKGDGQPRCMDYAKRVLFIGWVDNTNIAIIESSLLEYTDNRSVIAPKQNVSQILIFNTVTRRANIMLEQDTDLFPMVDGGSINFGTYNGKSGVFLKAMNTRGDLFLYSAHIESGHSEIMHVPARQEEDWVVTPDGRILAARTWDRDTRLSGVRTFFKGGGVDIAQPHPGRWLALSGLGSKPDTVSFVQDGDLYDAALTGEVSGPLQPRDTEFFRAFRDRTTHALIGIEYRGQQSGVVFFDPDREAKWKAVAAAFPGKRVRLFDFDAAFTNFVVYVDGDGLPGSSYWVDMTKGSAELLARDEPLVASLSAPSQAFSFKAADGLALDGRLATPKGVAPRDLPAVVVVHDLNSMAYDGTFDRQAQFLAQHGYAVVSVNYRGTRGDGSALGLAGDGQLGLKMQSDLDDAVAELAKQGVVDPKRVCFLGDTYGAYAALMAMSEKPDRYRCAIAVHPVVDLWNAGHDPAYASATGEWSGLPRWRRAVGEDNESQSKLKALSPIDHIADVGGPVLIEFRNWDGNRFGYEVERTIGMLKAAGKTVEVIRSTPTKDQQELDAQTYADYESWVSFLDKYDARQ